MAHSNYSDKKEEFGGGFSEHRNWLENPRAYIPSDGETHGAHPGFAEHSTGGEHSGDWSWKPWRDERLGKDFVTFLGVPKSAAELYGPRICT